MSRVLRRYWLLFLSMAWLLPAQAALRLELDTQGLDAAERHASQQLLDQAVAHLPERMRQALDTTVQVGWRADLPENAMGRASRLNRFDLNRRWLAVLLDPVAAQQPSGRTHGTLQRELLATMLHEMAHLYDRKRAWSAPQRRLIQRCQSQMQRLGQIGLRDECRGQTQRRFTLSDDPQWLDLAGWPQQVGKRGEREAVNQQTSRSPDRYELSNAREFFAVNLEYFLLDPQYACRRPGLHRALREHFSWAPPQAECASRYAYMNAGLDPRRDILGSLDPKQVYQVHYLLAEPNQNWVSRWGHSMLRLVICAPGREPGPDCLLDLQHHLVLSYRAFVDDVQLSSWDGLTGAYPSRLFILPLSQVIDEYTKLELRDLSSIPIALPQTELQHLVEQSVQAHWSYDGDYYFLSNNCAVETLKLLRAGTARADLQALDSVTPTGLLALLKARHLADTSVLDDPQQALRLGYRFDSFRARYESMFAIAQTRLALPYQSLDQWLALAAAQRRQWIAQDDLRSAAALLLLEQAALRRQLLLAQDELKQHYLSTAARADQRVVQAGDTMQQILAGSGFLSRPAELLNGGYGLPQALEWQQLQEQSQARQTHLRGLASELDVALRALVSPERREELEGGEQNIRLLGQHLRQLHKRSGGLQLP